MATLLFVPLSKEKTTDSENLHNTPNIIALIFAKGKKNMKSAKFKLKSKYNRYIIIFK